MEMICRFCFNDSNNNDNRLIESCKCIGSIKYIHTNCLLRWRISEIPFINVCNLCKTTRRLEKPPRY